MQNQIFDFKFPIDYEAEYKIYCNALKLLKARGYAVPEKGIDLLSEEQFKAKFETDPRGNSIHIFQHSLKPRKIVLNLNFERFIPFSAGSMEALIGMYQSTCVGMIMVYRYRQSKKFGSEGIPASDKAMQAVSFANKSNFLIQFFREEQLMFCLIEHELVPKHELLSDEERGRLLEKYKIKMQQLPKILIHDPVVKYLGLHIGDIVKITRRSDIASTSVSYRYVATI